jgi:hypothetical protein
VASRSSALLRPVAALATGALALHELRYRLAGASPAADGAHAYLPGAEALVLVLLVVAGGAWLRAMARGDARDERPPSFARGWLRAGAALLAVHLGQEATEALVATGGVVGALGGAWTAVPLALALGGLVALVLRGADSAVRAARRRGSLAHPASVPSAACLVPSPDAPVRTVLSPGRAGRAPPLAAA